MNHARELALGEEAFVGERFSFIALLPPSNAAPLCRNWAFLPWSPFPQKPLMEPSCQCCWLWYFCFRGSSSQDADDLMGWLITRAESNHSIYLSAHRGLTLQISYNCIDQSYLNKAGKGGRKKKRCRDQKLCLVSGSKSKARSFP